MILKPDEIYVKDCLINHFGADITTAQEGENPPDIYLYIRDKKIAVEITRLSPVSFDQNGAVQNRNTQDFFGLTLCNEMDSKLRKDVPPEVDIILTLYLPVNNPRKYKKELCSYLKNVLDSGINIGDSSEIDISGSKVKISVVPSRSHAQRKIVGLIVNNNSSADILNNAKVILANRISDKVKKCKKIQHQGSIWLALFNDYLLSDHDIYSQAINNISIQHYFEMIFVISNTKVVTRIY